MRTLHGLLVAAFLCGCATARPLAPTIVSDPCEGCRLLVVGKFAEGETALGTQLGRKPADPLALFAAGTLAYERGDSERAGDHFLRLLEVLVDGDDRRYDQLATAALSRLSTVFAEVPDRRLFEDRALALTVSVLPWQARYNHCLLGLDIGRKRGDEAIYQSSLRACGTLPALSYVADGGSAPLLDLKSSARVERPVAVPWLPVGIKQQLRVESARVGVKVVRGDFTVDGGVFDLVVDTTIPLRYRVDGGTWIEHGTDVSRYEPRWSGHRMELAHGKHSIELRLASYGASAEITLVAMPASTRGQKQQLVDAGEWSVLADALAANATGDTRSLSSALDTLSVAKQFAVGLAAVGRLYDLDPSRPQDLLRDKAHAYTKRAVALDGSLARAWTDLAVWESHSDRSREAADAAKHATVAAPGFWPAWAALSAAYRASGFDRDTDLALARAAGPGTTGQGQCGLIQRLFERAQEREKLGEAERWISLLSRCDASAERPRQYAREHGYLAKAEAMTKSALPMSPDPLWLRLDLVDLALAAGNIRRAEAELVQLSRLAPRDTQVQLSLAGVRRALGKTDAAQALLTSLLARFPEDAAIRRAARLAGVTMPWESYRIDGGQVLAAFKAMGKSYDAPQVGVLDRAVEQILPDGARIILTHSITQVLSKDAIETVGEVKLPAGAEVLLLRTRKANGQIREAESIPGKSSISAPDLTVGDFVEVETLEVKPPRESFPEGFMSERFFFQSFEAPFQRSEYLVLVPKGMAIAFHSRGDSPAMREEVAPQGYRAFFFQKLDGAQLFAERSATPSQEWIPQIAISGGASFKNWSRFYADRLARVAQGNPDLEKVAASLGNDPSPTARAKAVVEWVNQNIEPERDSWSPATYALARGRGNRAAVAVALARSLSIPVDFVLARSNLQPSLSTPLAPTDFESFSDLFVRFRTEEGDRFYDPRLSRSPFGYLLESYTGGEAVVVGTDQRVPLRSTVEDRTKLTLHAEVQRSGEGRLRVSEVLQGWPALEWRELWERVGKDQVQQRQEFEQRWLGQLFPGARLLSFSVQPGILETRIDCEFVVPRFMVPAGETLRFRPHFFRAQWGRRFASDPERRTDVQVAFVTPVELDVDIVLPPGTQAESIRAQVGTLASTSLTVPGIPGSQFTEVRRMLPESRLSLHRAYRLPNARIPSSAYPKVADIVRQMDAAESAEIILIPPTQGK